MSTPPVSKAKFQQPSKAAKGPSSAVTGAASSAGFGVSAVPKKTGQVGATTGGAGRGVPQVIFNGKISTPQSLISGRPAVAASQQRKAAGLTAVTTIPENEATDKPSPLKQFKKAPTTVSEGGGLERSRHSMGHSMLLAEGAKKAVEEQCTVIISETATETLLHIRSQWSASDLREVAHTTERNKRYDALVDTHKTAVDSFSAKPTQTLNHTQKSQNEMAAPTALRDCSSQVTAYEITDATGVNKKQFADAETQLLTSVSMDAPSAAAGSGVVGGKKGFGATVQKFVEDTVSVAMVTPGCLLDVEAVNKEKPIAEKKEGTKPKKATTGTSTGGPPPTVSMVSGAIHGASASGVNASGGGSGSNALAGLQGSAPIKASHASGTDVAGSSDHNNSGNDVSSGHAAHGGGGDGAQDSTQILFEKQASDIMKSPMLLKRLQMLERAVQQNAYHRNQLDYRDLPDVPPLNLVTSERTQVVENVDQLFGGFGGGLGRLGGGGAPMTSTAVGDDDGGPAVDEDEEVGSKKVKKLFNFYFADLVQGRSVTAMAWNAVNCDLLAVGYGKLDQFTEPAKIGEAVDEQLQGGLVLFWSLRNPEYPEKILRTPHPVTALDFSISSPMTLALGQVNGDICIYDVKREDWSTPTETSESIRDASLTHSDPVWQLRWLVRGIEKNETLVSISTDGAVLEWNLKKGLAVSTLMHLKRSGMGEGWISRQAAGLCFDFAPDDAGQATYIVGTEEGSLHKCSVSYNEQYLETYRGHDGPLYRIRFSRNCPNLFLTCSADWSMGLYDIRHKAPLAVMKSSGEDFSINDICWCPGNSTVFAAITADSKLQIWDLSVSNLDPVESYDTSVDDVTEVHAEAVADASKEERSGTAVTSKPNTAASTSRYESRFDRREEEKEPPVSRLLRNLSMVGDSKRVLTTVLFGARSPTVVVGDNRGAVTVYRIFDPLTITHEGPLQQAAKLQRSVPQPSDAATSSSTSH